MSAPGIVFLDESSRCRRASNRIGILGCIISVLGIFTFGLASPIGLGLSLLGMLWRPRGAATFGTIIGGMGTAFLALFGGMVVAGVSAVDTTIKVDQTEQSMLLGVEAIQNEVRESGRLPDGIDGNKLLIEANLLDAWGESLRYDRIEGNGYLIRSAGADRQFDTSDDLTRS